MTELVFVLAPGQNAFFPELIGALRHELHGLGVASTTVTGAVPAAVPGRVYVLVPPHEYFALQPTASHPSDSVLRRTIFLSAEQPTGKHFAENLAVAPRAGAVFDISARATAEYRRNGVDAQHLQLGYSPYWERTRAGGERDIDVLFMGSESPRRARSLAAFSPVLSNLRCRILLSDNTRPNAKPAANFLVGLDKERVLRRSRVLLNIHQSTEPYFEWLRIVEALHAGCVVLSETSTDCQPLVPSRHFVAGDLWDLPQRLEELMGDAELLDRMAAEAYRYIKQQLPLRAGAVQLVAAAQQLNEDLGVARRARQVVRGRASRHAARVGGHVKHRLESAVRYYQNDTYVADMRSNAKELRLELMEIRRRAAQTRLSLEQGSPPPPIRRVLASAGYSTQRPPRISVITALYNQAEYVEAALRSVAGGTYQDFELIIVDDGSTDDSLSAVRRWSAGHPDVRMLLLQHPVNRGLPASRNAGLQPARGELVFILDSDNEVYPHCLQRLVSALDGDPDAPLAYGILACFADDQSRKLLSQFPWSPDRLTQGPYIDAMALLRTEVLRSLGGYTTDPRLHGWEDYDLYCRIAERGMRPCFVPEILARYRVSGDSMISLTDLSHARAFAALEEHCPTLMRGALPVIEYGYFSTATAELQRARMVREAASIPAGEEVPR